MRFWGMGCLALMLLMGCWEEEVTPEVVIRGLKVHEVAQVERSQTRRFPGVLEPSELSVLSFEISGRLGDFNLGVGQRLAKDELVAKLHPETLQLQVEAAQASVAQAQASARNSADTLTRQRELLQRGTTTRVVFENAQAEADAAAAGLVQAQKSLETAQENLAKSELRAPFSGIVNSVDANAFATVSAGAPIATLYSPDEFEVAFSVSFDAASALVVGKQATIRLADRPEITLAAVVSEIGSRADAVSSFPIVLLLRETHPLLKAGMAVEAAIEFPLPKRQGFPIPLSALIKDGQITATADAQSSSLASVYVYDTARKTVQRRGIAVGGIRENMVVVVDGLAPGDLVASAGVSFLKEGQEVRLLGSED